MAETDDAPTWDGFTAPDLGLIEELAQDAIAALPAIAPVLLPVLPAAARGPPARGEVGEGRDGGAELGCAGLGFLERHGNDLLHGDLEVIGMAGKLVA